MFYSWKKRMGFFEFYNLVVLFFKVHFYTNTPWLGLVEDAATVKGTVRFFVYGFGFFSLRPSRIFFFLDGQIYS